MDQTPESRFGLRFSACGVLDLCHVRNVKKLDQVNCAKFKYTMVVTSSDQPFLFSGYEVQDIILATQPQPFQFHIKAKTR